VKKIFNNTLQLKAPQKGYGKLKVWVKDSAGNEVREGKACPRCYARNKKQDTVINCSRLLLVDDPMEIGYLFVEMKFMCFHLPKKWDLLVEIETEHTVFSGSLNVSERVWANGSGSKGRKEKEKEKEKEQENNKRKAEEQKDFLLTQLRNLAKILVSVL